MFFMDTLILVLLCLTFTVVTSFLLALYKVHKTKKETEILQEKTELHKIAQKLSAHMIKAHLTTGKKAHDVFCKMVFVAETRKSYVTLPSFFKALLWSKKNIKEYVKVDAIIKNELNKHKKLQGLKDEFEKCLMNLIYLKHYNYIIALKPFFFAYLLGKSAHSIKGRIVKNVKIIKASYAEKPELVTETINFLIGIRNFITTRNYITTYTCTEALVSEQIVEYEKCPKKIR